MSGEQVQSDIVDGLEEEITNRRKKYREVKARIMKKIMFNFIIAIVIVAYWLLLMFGKMYLEKALFITICRAANVVVLLITIGLFEVAYKKNNFIIATYGVEMMILSLCALFLPYVYYEVETSIRVYLASLGVIMAVYYLIKAGIIYFIEKRKYIQSKSEISKITKKVSKYAEVEEHKEDEEDSSEMQSEKKSIKDLKELLDKIIKKKEKENSVSGIEKNKPNEPKVLEIQDEEIKMVHDIDKLKELHSEGKLIEAIQDQTAEAEEIREARRSKTKSKGGKRVKGKRYEGR